MSQSRARWNDPPMTHPLQATMTGASSSHSCWTPRCPRLIKSWWDSGTLIVPIEPTSRPDENDLPSPRQMMARTSGRCFNSARMSNRRTSMSSSKALCLAGLSLVITATGPSISSRTFSLSALVATSGSAPFSDQLGLPVEDRQHDITRLRRKPKHALGHADLFKVVELAVVGQGTKRHDLEFRRITPGFCDGVAQLRYRVGQPVPADRYPTLGVLGDVGKQDRASR